MFEKLRCELGYAKQYFRARLELHALDKQLAQEPRPELPKIVRYDPRRGPIWRLNVPGKADAFMCLPIYAGSNYRVVYVHGTAFYRAWLASGVRDYQACPLRREMQNDGKFKHAVSGFAEGSENPVPIAEVAPSNRSSQLFVGFNDGMTRTLWLLANHVPAFPVLCGGQHEALMLAEAVGLAKPVRYETLQRI